MKSNILKSFLLAFLVIAMPSCSKESSSPDNPGKNEDSGNNSGDNTGGDEVEPALQFNWFSSAVNGIESGLVTGDGQYAALGINSTNKNGAVVILGKLDEDGPKMIVRIDTVSLVRDILCEDILTRLVYNGKSVNAIDLSRDGSKLASRAVVEDVVKYSKTAGTLTEKEWYKIMALVSSSVPDAMKLPLLTQYKDLKVNAELTPEQSDLTLINAALAKAVEEAQSFDLRWDRYMFGGIGLTELKATATAVDAERISCTVSGVEAIPDIAGLDIAAVCRLWLRANDSEVETCCEKTVAEDGEVAFEVNGLELGAQYAYRAGLGIGWIEAQASSAFILCSDFIPGEWTGAMKENAGMFELNLDGSTFRTATPTIVTGIAVDITATWASVKCAFYNVPATAACGIEYTNGTNVSTVLVNRAGTSDGDELSAVISNLAPAVTYTYKAFVETAGKTYYGDEKTFTTLKPSCVTGACASKTQASAVLTCDYKNIAGDCECGVAVTEDGTDNVKLFPTTAIDGERQISISGLEPCTTYSYYAYINFGGEIIKGEVKKFTTELPDISGVWNCKETRTSGGKATTYTYTITLNADGTASSSEFSSAESSSWSFSASGSVYIKIVTIATMSNVSWTEWKCNVNEVKSPTEITGYRQDGNANQIGSFSGDAWPVVMTRQN
ncbi:MAG: hypothetical protein ACI3Z0_07580 [Candidatus Cryptobacteroides sp.]